jgi:ABC-type multidrug transport system ATPase subunit
MNTVVDVENITKFYNTTCAVDNINLRVIKGEIFGLVGPDGSGKTTLIRMIASLIKQNSGKIQVLGFDNIKDYKSIRKVIGYMPGKFSLYQDLTVEENLNLFATIYDSDIKTNYHLIEDIYSHLVPFKDRQAGKLSGGMKQKLALSCSLIHKPELLLLDEPTTGVDPVSRRDLWKMLKKLKDYGITTIVSTPYMDEAALCDRIALFQNGRILESNSPLEITGKYENIIYNVKSDNNYLTLQALRKFSKDSLVYPFGESLHYVIDKNDSEIELFQEFINNHNIGKVDFELIEPTIEDAFILLMQVKKSDIL